MIFPYLTKVRIISYLKHPAAILIFRKTEILTSAALHTTANPEYRNSLSVPIGLTVPTDSSCYIFVTSITTSPLC